MQDFLAPGTITLATISARLEAAGVDHAEAAEGSIYVTGVAFPLWIMADPERDGVLLSTHWLFADAVAEDEALHFANALNCEMLMVQFSVPDGGQTLWGHYWLSCRHGLSAAQFLRTVHRFSGCFAEAAVKGRNQGVLSGGIAPVPALVN